MNLEQLNAMTDLELDEAVALATGIEPLSDEVKAILESGFSSVKDEGYHPTANTVEGRSQCFELMVKYRFNVDFSAGFVLTDIYKTPRHSVMFGENTNQRAIVIAAILSAQEK